MNKKIFSQGFLGAAVAASPWALITYIANANEPNSAWWMYVSMGFVMVLLLLHWLFRDEDFDKLQTMKTIIRMLLPNLTVIILYTLFVESFIVMFASLGFLAVTYLIHLSTGVFELKAEDID